MLTPVAYGNGTQASHVGIATFALYCQRYCTKLTCSILDLEEELDVTLGHERCIEYRVMMSYKDEYVDFVYKNKPQWFQFDDSDVQSHPASPRSAQFVRPHALYKKQQHLVLDMVCRVTELLGGMIPIRELHQRLLQHNNHHRRLILRC